MSEYPQNRIMSDLFSSARFTVPLGAFLHFIGRRLSLKIESKI